MRKLVVFNNISLDGYFVDSRGDMSWAHRGSMEDAEFAAFIAGNAEGGGELVFGRVTYDLMASYWPTPFAMESNPTVAEAMNNLPKVVFSRKLDTASWNNTKLVRGEPAAEIRKMKAEPGRDMVIMGSGSIVAQLAPEGLIDEYQIVLNPVVLGQGRTLFEGMNEALNLKLTKSRSFANGKVFLRYEPTV